MENTGDSEDSIQHLKHERHFNEEYKNGSVSEVSTYYLHTYTYLFTISSCFCQLVRVMIEKV